MKSYKNALLLILVVILLFSPITNGQGDISEQTVVEVIYEKPQGINPFGHSALRIGDKVYDVYKPLGIRDLFWSLSSSLFGFSFKIIRIFSSGDFIEDGCRIRERSWTEVDSDKRDQDTERVILTDERVQQLKKIVANQVGSEFDFNAFTNNCADWVENQLREVGTNIPDNIISYPKSTWRQAEDLIPVPMDWNGEWWDSGKWNDEWSKEWGWLCPSCGGSGQVIAGFVPKTDTCLSCGGTGETITSVSKEVSCLACGGSGKTIVGATKKGFVFGTCSLCKGNKVINRSFLEFVTCSHCNGTKVSTRHFPEYDPCSNCNEIGKIEMD